MKVLEMEFYTDIILPNVWTQEEEEEEENCLFCRLEVMWADHVDSCFIFQKVAISENNMFSELLAKKNCLFFPEWIK
jgi:hypothetical protein